MSEEKQPKFNFQEKGKGGKKGPKFNIYWIYGVVIVGLLVSQIMNFSPELKKTTEQEFKQQMLLAGDVTKLDFVKNKDEVQVYINGDSLKKEFYVKKFGVVLPKEKVKGAPLFVFEVLDWKSFDENLQKFTEQHQLPEVKRDIVKAADWMGGVLQSIFTLVIIVVVWLLLMRKMGGGAGGPGGGAGGIFNIGKSKATLFDKGAKVNINFGDVAGLDEAKVEVMEIVDFLKNPKNTQHLAVKFQKELYL